MDSITTSYTNGKISSKKWYIKGKTDKISLLKSEAFHSDGNLYIQQYFKNGEYHKDFNEPAMTQNYSKDQCAGQSWYVNGKLHNDDDKPAETRYHENGKLSLEEWYKNGILHRDNNPAKIMYYEDGNVEYKFWYQNGKLQRDIEPAIIHYNKDGTIANQEWYKEGVEYNPNEVKSIVPVVDNHKCPHCNCDIKLTYTIMKED